MKKLNNILTKKNILITIILVCFFVSFNIFADFKQTKGELIKYSEYKENISKNDLFKKVVFNKYIFKIDKIIKKNGDKNLIKLKEKIDAFDLNNEKYKNIKELLIYMKLKISNELENRNLSKNIEGFDFKISLSGDFSILDIDLNKIKLSFGGIDIDKENIHKFDRYNRFFAKDFKKNFNELFLKDKDIIALVNGQFFTNVREQKTGLSFPLKSFGIKINQYTDNEISKRTFVIDKNNNAKILEGFEKIFLHNEDNKEVIVAFTPRIKARSKQAIGRTYIGIKSQKNVVFFIAKNKTQSEMNKIISDYGISANNVIMMDGGPSSQFAYFEKDSNPAQFYGTWGVPQVFVIYKNK